MRGFSHDKLFFPIVIKTKIKLLDIKIEERRLYLTFRPTKKFAGIMQIQTKYRTGWAALYKASDSFYIKLDRKYGRRLHNLFRRSNESGYTNIYIGAYNLDINRVLVNTLGEQAYIKESSEVKSEGKLHRIFYWWLQCCLRT